MAEHINRQNEISEEKSHRPYSVHSSSDHRGPIPYDLLLALA